jgi:hypothetical protein
MKRSAQLAALILATLTMSASSLARPPHRGADSVGAHPARSDQVIAWNQELLQLLQVPGAQPAGIHPTRTLAITQLAVYDAVNAIKRGGAPYLFRGSAPRDASAEAAAAAAARTVLLALLPSQQPAIETTYNASLAAIGAGRRVDEGIRVGDQAARRILAARASDGAATTPPPFVPQPGPGEYQLTPPNFAPAAFTQTAHVRPFVLIGASQFRPPAPPALTSARYADDWAEVKSLGELTSTSRSANQTDAGRFWGAAPIWIVWNQIAEQAAGTFHDSLEQNARLFALLDATLGDGAISLYDAKYAYHRWRPITAITAADQGNPTTTSDPGWVPLANTANDPSYPGAHAEFSRAAATVLDAFFGTDNFAFSLTNATTGITRSFESFSDAADEATASRIFAGQHFRYDEDAGQALGAQVANFVLDNALTSR